MKDGRKQKSQKIRRKEPTMNVAAYPSSLLISAKKATMKRSHVGEIRLIAQCQTDKKMKRIFLNTFFI